MKIVNLHDPESCEKRFGEVLAEIKKPMSRVGKLQVLRLKNTQVETSRYLEFELVPVFIYRVLSKTYNNLKKCTIVSIYENFVDMNCAHIKNTVHFLYFI